MSLILLFLVFITIVLAILFHDVVKTFRIFRSNAEKAAERAAKKAAAEEEYFRRTSKKYYREDEKPHFDKDYFKGTENTQGQAEGQKRTTVRRTTTSDGVTIIDQREERKTDKKFFSEDEGEYVEFTEVE